jgi:hypothetical protein
MFKVLLPQAMHSLAEMVDADAPARDVSADGAGRAHHRHRQGADEDRLRHSRQTA